MLGIINSEWLRTKSLKGTWILLGFAVLSLVLPAALTLNAVQNLQGQGLDLAELGAINASQAGGGLVPALMFIIALSAVRVSSERAHNLHAQSFLVISARWKQVAASMLVNMLLSVVTGVIGLAIALVLLSSTPLPLMTNDAGKLGWMVLAIAAISVMASAIGVLIPSVAGAVALPLIWATAFEGILVSTSQFFADNVAPYLPFNNVFMLVSTQPTVHTPAVSGIILILWAGLLAAAAFFVNESRDVK